MVGVKKDSESYEVADGVCEKERVLPVEAANPHPVRDRALQERKRYPKRI